MFFFHTSELYRGGAVIGAILQLISTEQVVKTPRPGAAPAAAASGPKALSAATGSFGAVGRAGPDFSFGGSGGAMSFSFGGGRPRTAK